MAQDGEAIAMKSAPGPTAARTAKPRYNRVLVKLSGEVLNGDQGFGIDSATLRKIAMELRDVRETGVEVAVVIGGGNIFRGLSAEKEGYDRVTADQMGMLATLINALALQNALESIGVNTRVQSAIEINRVAEPFIRRKAVRHLEKGRVLIFACGTGNPYFTTDSAAALRAAEIGADVLMKATKVDGIYSADPVKDPNARFYPEVTYAEVLNQNLKVMDAAAISICRENDLPILVFNIYEQGNILKAVTGETTGSIVKG